LKDSIDNSQQDWNQLEENCSSGLRVLIKTIDSVKMLTFTSGIMRNLMMDLLDLAQLEKNTFSLNQDYFSIFEVID
jgi:hypothetical protein